MNNYKIFFLFVSLLSVASPAIAAEVPFSANQMQALVFLRSAYASLEANRVIALVEERTAKTDKHYWEAFFRNLVEEGSFLSRFEVKQKGDGRVEIEIGFACLSDEGKQFEKTTRRLYGELTADGVKLSNY